MLNKRLLNIFLLVFLTGCTTVEKYPVYTPSAPLSASSGVYHEVLKGETLYSIAKAYNIEINKLAKVNHIPDKTSINQGQLIFIPDVENTVDVSALRKASSQRFIWPINGKVISTYGSLIDNVVNKGIDLSIQGDQGVKASKAGEVVFVGKSLAGYGNTVIINHGNNISVVYSNLDNLLVEAGDTVQQGEKIANISDREIFHIEIRKGIKAVNPLAYLN